MNEPEENRTEPESAEEGISIRIMLTGLENFHPSYSFTDLQVNVKYKNVTLDDSIKFPSSDTKIIPCSHEIHFKINPENLQELNDLLNNPIYFTIYESMASYHYSRYPTPREIFVEGDYKTWTSVSAINLVEAITGKEVDRTLFESLQAIPLNSSDIQVKENRSTKSTRRSRLGSLTVNAKNKTSWIQEKREKQRRQSLKIDNIYQYDYEPLLIGHCSLDLMCLFTGKQLVSKILPLYQDENYKDDCLVTEENLPRLHLKIFLPQYLIVPDVMKNSNILLLTMESIFNIPTYLTSDLHFQVAAFFPSEGDKLTTEQITNGQISSERYTDKRKKWPNLIHIHNLSALTKYKINTGATDVKSEFQELDLTKLLTADVPHIEWNILNRKFFTPKLENTFKAHLTENRFWPLEFYFTPTKWSKETARLSSSSSLRRGNSVMNKGNRRTSKENTRKTNSSIITESSTVKEDPQNDNFHFLAFVDLSNLLQPGVSKTRVVCQLRTFQNLEAKQLAGLELSHFVTPPPESKEVIVELPILKGKSKSKDKGKKSSPKSSKGAKETKESTEEEKNNLNEYLPTKPKGGPPPPSQPLFDENGNPVVVLLEVELIHPLFPKGGFQELTPFFYQIVSDIPTKPKIVAIGDIANSCYREIINNIVKHMNEQLIKFYEERCKDEIENVTVDQNKFMEYLNENGAYQTYLATIFKAALDLSREQFAYNGSVDRNSEEYQEYMAMIYTYLVKEMNVVINDVVLCGLERVERLEIDREWFYAREMMEMGADELAKRYYLERIVRDETNSQRWFEFGTFLLETGENEAALECMKEALNRDSNNKYALLTTGFLLANKEMWSASETCFLLLLALEPCFLEAWASLYLVYQYRNVKYDETMQFCLEMCAKCEQVPVKPDTINGIDDIAWTTEIAPTTTFYRTAVLLLKLRVLNFAEKALAMECHSGKTGIWHYYMGVLLYLAQNYAHAIQHLLRAEDLYGCNHAVGSLIGHCYVKMNEPCAAKKYYETVLTFYNKPVDMHMLYVYLAILTEEEKNIIEAKKYLMHVCKMSQTPFTWLALGIIYMEQRDSMSAEECFMQSNLLDNNLAEPWAYLTIIYLILGRISEANYCRRETKRCNLKSMTLLQCIKECYTMIED